MPNETHLSVKPHKHHRTPHTLSASALLDSAIIYTYITISISIEIRICRIYALLNYLIKPEGTPFSDTLYRTVQHTSANDSDIVYAVAVAIAAALPPP